MNTISNTDDVIDIRDVMARVEELEDMEEREDQESEELEALTDLLEEFRGLGGDEQWHGDWYPITLIRDSYFTDYAKELAEDIGAISKDTTWPNNCIDWEQAANELQTDYSSADFDGVTYWAR